MWSKPRGRFVMSKLSIVIFFLSACAVASCGNNTSSDSNVWAALTMNEGSSTLECLGRVQFTPETGITNDIEGDMKEVTDLICSSPSVTRNLHISSSSYNDGVYLESVKIDFSCANKEAALLNNADQLKHMCAKVFDNFDTKQP